MKVYCAGASKEITRVERWIEKLKSSSSEITVVSTWPQVIRAVGKANPTEATPEEYRGWVDKNLSELRSANVLWLFSPETDTIGAWVELGFAHALEKLIVVSGPHRPIHTPALAKFHSHYDAEVAEYLRGLATARP